MGMLLFETALLAIVGSCCLQFSGAVKRTAPLGLGLSAAGGPTTETDETPLAQPDTPDQGAVVQAWGRNQARNQ
jgi:hypothetical protein